MSVKLLQKKDFVEKKCVPQICCFTQYSVETVKQFDFEQYIQLSRRP